MKKTVVVVELPGGNDTDLLNALIDKGDSFIFVTADLQHYKSQADVWSVISQAKQVIVSETFDVDYITSELKKAHSIEGILCLVDIRIIEAAEIAECFSLPFLNVDTALMLRDKATVRLQLDNLGLAQPKFKLALSNEDLARAVSEIGLPCIIKPSDGYGSQNIVYLESESDLEPWISPIQDMLPSGAHYGLGVKANDRLLVEEFMPGQIIGCDTLTVNGEHYLLGINEKLFFAPPSFAIEGGSFTPNEGQFQEIEAYVFDILNGVYFNHGAAHIELKITSHGLRLIEVNPRLVGAKIPRLISYAIGSSIYNMLIDLHTGTPVMLPEYPAGVATSRWITAESSGVFADISLPLERPEQIKCVEILKKAGDHVRPPFENADRIGYVMTCDKDRHHAENVAQNFVNATKLHLVQPQQES